MEYLIYFIAGVAQDFLSTLNWRYVAEKKIIPAMIFSFLTVAVGMVVLYNIVKDLDPQKSILAIIIYCGGIAVGTFLAMRFRIGSKN
jgi:ABC-type maltose transport system permease subunit